MKNILIGLAVVTGVLSTPSHAVAEKRIYGGLEYGVASVEDNTQSTASAFVAAYGGSATATQDASVGVGRLFFGYRLTPQAAIEGGYFASSTIKYRISGRTSGAVDYTGSADIEYDGFDISAVWAPMAQSYGDSSFFLKAGLHRSSVDASVSATASVAGASASTQSRLSESGTGMLFGAGYDWKYSENAFVRIAATHYSKIAGDSDNKGTIYSIAVGANF
jgi:hypothetical protein